mmetsp:Transcript_19863/g.52020  ORF Transcript_19863/g.52020 Transcript_19863/m.52020 type:complete len:202 (+) Transcript_19863:254-859(+)
MLRLWHFSFLVSSQLYAGAAASPATASSPHAHAELFATLVASLTLSATAASHELDPNAIDDRSSKGTGHDPTTDTDDPDIAGAGVITGSGASTGADERNSCTNRTKDPACSHGPGPDSGDPHVPISLDANAHTDDPDHTEVADKRPSISESRSQRTQSTTPQKSKGRKLDFTLSQAQQSSLAQLVHFTMDTTGIRGELHGE